MYKSDEDKYLVGIPRPVMGGSYGTYCRFDETAKIYDTFPQILPKDGLPRVEFRSW